VYKLVIEVFLGLNVSPKLSIGVTPETREKIFLER